MLEAHNHLRSRSPPIADLHQALTTTQTLAATTNTIIASLDEESESLTLDTDSITKAILEEPRQNLLAQQNAAKGELLAELKADGVEYSERMARLDEVSWPTPLEEDLEAALEIYARTRPWVRVED